MMQTEEQSLQSVLREKYNIDEPLFAEGRFVSLLDDHAANLVCLGLGMKCFVIAKIVFSGDTIDYDILSLVPLSLLSMTYQCSSQKVTVKSRFKPIQIFQLCSSADQAAVWDNFTSIIRDVYQLARGDVWISTPLKPVNQTPPSTFIKSAYEHQTPISSKDDIISINGSILRQYSRFTKSRVSFPSQISQWYYGTLPVCHSADCFNGEFDSFVNDTPLPLTKESDLNMSNSNIVVPSDTFVDVDSRRQSESKVMKFFRRVVSCCKGK